MSSRARPKSFYEPDGKKATDAELDAIFERMKARGLVPQSKSVERRLAIQNSPKVIKDVTRGKR